MATHRKIAKAQKQLDEFRASKIITYLQHKQWSGYLQSAPIGKRPDDVLVRNARIGDVQRLLMRAAAEYR